MFFYPYDVFPLNLNQRNFPRLCQTIQCQTKNGPPDGANPLVPQTYSIMLLCVGDHKTFYSSGSLLDLSG